MGMIKKYIYPTRVVKTYGDIAGADELKREKDLQIGFYEPSVCVMNPGSSVILDFGKELQGGVRIITFMGGDDCFLRIRFGESVSECMAELGEKNATNNHAVRDRTVCAPDYSDMEYGNTGFRFVKLDNVGGRRVVVKAAVAYLEMIKMPKKGSFECDDKLINKIFRVSSYTVDLCVQNGLIWDGIKRDRLVWIGDIHPEMLSLSTLYGRFAPIEKSLDFIKRQTPLPAWMNNIPTYSMWWMIILHDYYLRTGCMDYLAEQKEYLLGLLKQIDENISPEGEILYTGYLLDWPTHEQPDEIPGVRALNVLAVQKAAKILAFLKEDCDLPEKILAKLAQKRYPVADKKQVKAFECLAYGEHTPETLRFLTQGGVKGFSIFMIYYILKSIVLCGGEDESVELLKKYYGGMLAMGATTFWEDFDIDWTENATKITELPKRNKKDIHGDYGRYCYVGFRHSFCHGWASGPIGYLSECVAGFNATEPGKLTIHPHLGTLRYVKAKFPTPYGVVEVYHEKENGKTVTACRAPREVAVTFEGCEVKEFRQY